ncbi:MAG: hypothetical protein NTZ44_00920 [Candidatus Nomurabacteria bacterium]|nr:hypothetical protein [Candidatus Nomurabacteria bacterium]
MAVAEIQNTATIIKYLSYEICRIIRRLTKYKIKGDKTLKPGEICLNVENLGETQVWIRINNGSPEEKEEIVEELIETIGKQFGPKATIEPTVKTLTISIDGLKNKPSKKKN